MLSRFKYTSVSKYRPIKMKAHSRANKLFAFGTDENNEDYFPLDLLNVKIEQQKYLRKLN